MILGDGFLRNVHTLFNYGDFLDPALDETKDAFIQLLALENVEDALRDFHSSRQNSLATLPPEATVDQVNRYVQERNSSPDSDSDSLSAASNDSVSASTSNSSALLGRINIFGPVVIGLLGGTLLIGILLCGIALAMCVRKGASMGSRKSAPAYAPVRYKEEGPRAEDEPYPTQYSD